MNKFIIGLVVLFTFQKCTSELNEIDGVIGNYIDSDIMKDGSRDNFTSIPSESFLSQYFSTDFKSPISTRIENQIRHDFNSPVNQNEDPKELSAKWTGNFYFDAGEYTFSIKSNKGIKVIIDDEVVINDPDNQKVTIYELNQKMDGVHKLTVEYNIEEVIESNAIEPIDSTVPSNNEPKDEGSNTSTGNEEISNPDNIKEGSTETIEEIDKNESTEIISPDNDNSNASTINEETTTPSIVITEPTEIVDNSEKVVETENETPTVEVEWEPVKDEAQDEELQKLIPMGWAAITKGGDGGRIIKVTNLNKEGKGSFREAIDVNEPRIIVFEVGGVIDLEGNSLNIGYPYLTVMGQTAPSPGITFIRGGLNVYASEVIIQHLRIRPGQNKKGVDGLGVASVHHVIIDHCSFSWGTDENLSASGPRFDGNNLSEWRKNTSNTITFSYNIIAEALDGGGSKGTLVHDNVTEMALIGNIYASNADRNPLFKGGTSGVVVNNLIYNAKNIGIQYKLVSQEWNGREIVTGKMSVVGNVLEKGPDSRSVLIFGGFSGGPIDLYWNDNLVIGEPIQNERVLFGSFNLKNEAPVWPEIINVLPANQLKEYLLENSGARSWDRDEVDVRIIDDIKANKSKIIDSEQEVGGFPNSPSTFRKFDPIKWGL